MTQVATDWLLCPLLLREATRNNLGAVSESPLDDDLARAVGNAGRFHLEANRWRTPNAEARVVLIQGMSTAIFNCLVFPDRPDQAPTFVAEMLVVGGTLKIFFVDLQHPGMTPVRRGVLQYEATRLAEPYSAWQSAEVPPAWATEFSAGGAVYVRPTFPLEGLSVIDVYSEYLMNWCSLARRAEAGAPPAPAAAELALFKQHHVEQSPVAGYLERVFGASWAGRFLTRFLYR